jgi:hypothetical protein
VCMMTCDRDATVGKARRSASAQIMRTIGRARFTPRS